MIKPDNGLPQVSVDGQEVNATAKDTPDGAAHRPGQSVITHRFRMANGVYVYSGIETDGLIYWFCDRQSDGSIKRIPLISERIANDGP